MELEDDLKKVKEQRRKVEQERRELEDSLEQANENHLMCANGEWQVVWNAHFDTAEEKREQIENLNSERRKTNQSLEQTRIKLEKDRRELEMKHTTKNSDYKIAYLEYADRFRIDYLLPMEQLVEDYRKYISSMKRYIAFINGATRACQQEDFTEVGLALGLDLLNRIFPSDLPPATDPSGA